MGVERVNRLGGGGDGNDESCVSVRAGRRERSTVKRKRVKGCRGDVVMMMVRDDEMWLNEKLFVR